MKKRIVIASDSLRPYVSGVGTAVDEILSALKEHDITLIGPENSEEECYKQRIIRFPSTKLRREYHAVLWIGKNNKERLYNILSKADIVILESITPLTIWLAILIKIWKLRIKVVLHLHTQYDAYAKDLAGPLWPLAVLVTSPLIWLMCSLSSIRLCPSENYRRILKWRNLVFWNIKVWEAPVNLPDAEPDKIKTNLFWAKGNKVLVFCGRIGKEKNIESLLDVFLAAHSEDHNTHLALVGGGEITKYEELCILKCGYAAENVHFIGSKSRQEIANIYYYFALNSKSVFAISMSVTETQGIAFLEQILLGFLGVVLEKTCFADYFQNNHGILILPRKKSRWRNKLIGFLSQDPTKLLIAGKSNREYSSSRFSTEICHGKFINIIFAERST